MTPELKATWIEALRSGKYHQAHGYLHPKDEGFCCLGVLLDIYEPNGWQVSYPSTCAPRRVFMDHAANPDSISMFCESFMRRIGLTINQVEKLVCLNDDEDDPQNFKQIADWIEENV